MEDEIDLRDIFGVLRKRRLLIIGVFMVAVLVAGVISFAMPPTYEVSSIVALGNFGEPIYTGQAAAVDIMLSDEFILDIIKEHNFSITQGNYSGFKESIKIEPVKGTDNLLMISIETKDKLQGIEVIDGIVRLFANRSEESYNKQMEILSDQLAVTEKNLNIIDEDINQTRDVLKGVVEVSGASAGTFSIDNEVRVSRTLDYLQAEETRRSALIDRDLDLKKQLTLSRHLDVVQKPTEPLAPIGPKKAQIVAVAGMLGLMVGIFAAFLREGLGKRKV
jgi:capsular polysaccharide biosynthesis protein